MTENSKKQPRKSKLIPREYIDLDDEKDVSTQMQLPATVPVTVSATDPATDTGPVTVPGQMLLPKIKNAIDTESHIKKSPSPVQFDIQVDVESFYDDNMCEELVIEDDLEDIGVLDEVVTSKEIIISDDAVRNEVEKLALSTNYVNRRIGVDIRNTWGKKHVSHIPDYYEELIQNIMQDWKAWSRQSTARSSILSYKCNICSIGWWHLGPFWDHIKVHEKLTLRLESNRHECSVVAGQGQWYETMCLCKIDGHCPMCLKTYEEHNTLKRNTAYYHCIACSETFKTCIKLFQHEGVCMRYERIIYQNAIPNESEWHCDICGISCLTQQRYDLHRLSFHSVRSDCVYKYPTMRDCINCDEKYLIYPLHACSKRTNIYNCKYCSRCFETKALLEIHEINTKKDCYCKICRRYLNSQCMEVGHLFKQHKSSFMSVYKCPDCLDHVFTTTDTIHRKHKAKWHKAKNQKYKNYKLLVPRSCLNSSWAEGVNVGDMVIDRSLQKRNQLGPVQDKQHAPESMKEIIQRNKLQAIEQARIDAMCISLRDKMLQRACYKAASKSKIDTKPNIKDLDSKQKAENEELLNALEGLKNDDDSNQDNIDNIKNALEGLKNADDSNQDTIDNIKQEYSNDDADDDDDDDLATDNDIMETQNSVDALLTNFAIKDEIEIEEQHWDCIVIDDSQDEDDDSHVVKVKKEVPEATAVQEKNTQTVIRKEENLQAIIKQANFNDAEGLSDAVENEKDSKDNKDEVNTSQEDVKQTENLSSMDDLKNKEDHKESAQGKSEGKEVNVDLTIVKQEPETEDDKKDVEYKNVCPEEKEKTIQNIDIKTEVFIKEEKEDYKECDDETENDIRKEQDACLAELSKVFRATKDASKIELSGISLSEDVNIKEELMDQDDYEDDIIMLYNNTPTFDLTDPDNTKEESKENSTSDISKDCSESEVIVRNQGPFEKILTDTGKEVIYQNKKTYRCKRCNFIGEHKLFKHHKTTVCKKKKHTKPRNHSPPKPLWPKMVCSKCDSIFTTMKSYFQHFTKHGVKRGRCPQCLHLIERCKADVHINTHVKHSFVRIQVIKDSSCVTSKINGLYQCKQCQVQVSFKDFFSHWESHLQFDNEDLEDSKPLVIHEEPKEEPAEVYACQLNKEKTKILLEQLVRPFEARGQADLRCSLCRRGFDRRNDVKRHVIEHLYLDARARRPELCCQLCQLPHDKSDSYKSHMRNHAALPVFRCEMCDKCFSDSSNFAKHKKVHNMQVLSICDLCNKKFHSRKGLEKHMEMHLTTKPVPCVQCDRVFFSQSAFNKHNKSKHMKVQTRVCRLCQERFTTMRSFWTHMWEAHKERSVKADCPDCHKSFRKIQDLRAHVRTTHRANMVQVRVGGAKQREQQRQHVESFLQTAKEVSVADWSNDTLVVFDDK